MSFIGFHCVMSQMGPERFKHWLSVTVCLLRLQIMNSCSQRKLLCFFGLNLALYPFIKHFCLAMILMHWSPLQVLDVLAHKTSQCCETPPIPIILKVIWTWSYPGQGESGLCICFLNMALVIKSGASSAGITCEILSTPMMLIHLGE